MSPVWEPDFSDHRYGFRPGRGAHGAVEAARAHVEAGHRWVVDLDLEKCFDRVNHDVLLARVGRKIGDQRVLGLIRAGRGRRLERFIEQDLNPVARGWANSDRQAPTEGVWEELDGWLRRHLRCLIWRRWKRVHTRARRLIALGFTEVKAWRCACNGRGPWWNAGSSHMNAAYPAATFQRLGLVSLLATVQADA